MREGTSAGLLVLLIDLAAGIMIFLNGARSPPSPPTLCPSLQSLPPGNSFRAFAFLSLQARCRAAT